MKLLAKNKRATYDYQVEEKLVAGLELFGAEVKSIKAGHASLKGSFINIRGGQAYLTNAQVTPYKNSADKSLDPTRSRKLLLHRKELEQLAGRIQDGRTIIPIALLQDRRLIKVEIGVARGKKEYDKRATIKERQSQREAARQVRAR